MCTLRARICTAMSKMWLKVFQSSVWSCAAVGPFVCLSSGLVLHWQTVLYVFKQLSARRFSLDTPSGSSPNFYIPLHDAAMCNKLIVPVP